MQHTPKEQGTTALFKNPVLEKLARTHISIPLSIYFIGSAILAYTSFSKGYTTPALGISVFFIGLLTWTLLEYLAHRYIFHMLPTNKIKEKIQYTFHGVHHEYPRDKTRLAMPPAASVLILTGLFFFFKLLIGNLAYTFLPGFIIGYSLYLGIHYMVHAMRPPKNSFNTLWIFHSIHHYKDDTVAFGVSSPLWDVIFGTLPQKTYKRDRKSSEPQEAREQQNTEIAA